MDLNPAFKRLGAHVAGRAAFRGKLDPLADNGAQGVRQDRLQRVLPRPTASIQVVGSRLKLAEAVRILPLPPVEDRQRQGLLVMASGIFRQ